MKRTRRVSPEIMLKAEHYLNIGYQKILTFERPEGGFDWWGRDPALVWLSAYGIQQLTALSKVKEIDTGVIDRAYQFLLNKMSSNGSWNEVGSTHGETISSIKNPTFALTAYVTWSLAKAGYKNVGNTCSYLKNNAKDAKDNPYLLALAANALLANNLKDSVGLEMLAQLNQIATQQENLVYWKSVGPTASYAYGESANIEVTALAILAMMEGKSHIDTINKALQYIIKNKDSRGTWGSTQATILALQCLVSAEFLNTSGGDATVKVMINDQHAVTWEINDNNRDVMQIVDLAQYTNVGANKIAFDVTGNPNIMYQVTTRHYEPWQKQEPAKPAIELDVSYDRTSLAKHETIVAEATLRYHGAIPTYMVIVDLGIPPGFTIDPGDFAELMGGDLVKKYSVTSSLVTLYLGDINPGDVHKFRYTLKAKYALKAKTPKSVAYEYYSPDVSAEAQPVLLEVE